MGKVTHRCLIYIYTIIITAMGVRASATVFKLSRSASSDSLEKDQWLLTLTQSTFLHLSFPVVISGIKGDSLSKLCLVSTFQVYLHCTKNSTSIQQKGILCSSLTNNRYKLAEEERRVQYHPRAWYNRETMRIAHKQQSKAHKLQKHHQYNYYTAATPFCPFLTVQDKRYSTAPFKCLCHQNLSCPQ